MNFENTLYNRKTRHALWNYDNEDTLHYERDTVLNVPCR